MCLNANFMLYLTADVKDEREAATAAIDNK